LNSRPFATKIDTDVNQPKKIEILFSLMVFGLLNRDSDPQ